MASTEPHDDEYQAAWLECNLNDRPIDWEFWVHKMPVLSATQASALMNGLDPGIRRDISDVDIDVNKAMANSEKLVSLAAANDVDQLSPAEWLNWADSREMAVHAIYRIEALKKRDTNSALNAAPSDTSMPPKQKPVPNWTYEAQRLAQSYKQRQKAKDLHPSQVDIADWVAEQLRIKGIYGTQGKPISGATIKRHALVGISTQQDKLRAIAKQWGKRGKK
jgi:hypothetical protein